MIKSIFILAACSFLLGGIVSCTSEMPNAMHVETMNQRAIAAGSWKHQQGYYDYQAVVEANNAQ